MSTEPDPDVNTLAADRDYVAGHERAFWRLRDDAEGCRAAAERLFADGDPEAAREMMDYARGFAEMAEDELVRVRRREARMGVDPSAEGRGRAPSGA